MGQHVTFSIPDPPFAPFDGDTYVATERRDFHIAFNDTDGEAVIRIWPGTGEVWIADSMTVDDAARQFWEGVHRLGALHQGEICE